MWLVADGSIRIAKVKSILFEGAYTSLNALEIEGVLDSGNKVVVTLSPEYTYMHLVIWIEPLNKFEFALHSFRYEVSFKTYKYIALYGKDVKVIIKFKRSKDYELAQTYFKKFWENWIRSE